jgi:glycerol uptake facilitator-like aquaporin
MWGSLGLTSWDPKVLDSSQAFFIEMLITAVLVFTVFASCDEKRADLNGSTPLSIGLSVSVCHLFAVSISLSPSIGHVRRWRNLRFQNVS